MNEYKLADVEIGMEALFSRTITLEMENAFRQITGDENPLHYDDEFAGSLMDGRFKNHVTFGMLTASLYSTLAGCYLPGKYSLIHSINNLKLLKPVYAGDTLSVHGEVADVQEDLNLIIVKAYIKNDTGQYISKATMKILVLA